MYKYINESEKKVFMTIQGPDFNFFSYCWNVQMKKKISVKTQQISGSRFFFWQHWIDNYGNNCFKIVGT